MYTLYIDESRRYPFLGLGGYYCLTSDELEITNLFNNFKKNQLLIPEYAPICWSPPRSTYDNNYSIFKEISDLIYKEKNITITNYRNTTIKFISTLQNKIELLSIICEDQRRDSKWRYSYQLHSTAFDLLIQRYSDKIKNLDMQYNILNSIVMDRIDFPKRNGISRYLEKRFNFLLNKTNKGLKEDLIRAESDKSLEQKYRKAFLDGYPSFSIPSLSELNFKENFYISNTARDVFLQIADFCIGATVYWIKANQAYDDKPHESNKEVLFNAINTFSLIEPMFKKGSDRLLGYGLFGFPLEVSRKVFDWLTRNLKRE